MANDTKRIGKKYRILTNAATRAWDVISFWTSSHDVEMDNGDNLQDTIDGMQEGTSGAIADINSNVTRIDNTLTTKVPFRFGIDGSGRYGYYKAGADTVTPFSSDIYIPSLTFEFWIAYQSSQYTKTQDSFTIANLNGKKRITIDNITSGTDVYMDEYERPTFIVYALNDYGQSYTLGTYSLEAHSSHSGISLNIPNGYNSVRFKIVCRPPASQTGAGYGVQCAVTNIRILN